MPDPTAVPSETPEESKYHDLSVALVTSVYKQSAISLQRLGFQVKEDSDIHWSDLVLCSPGVKWRETSKLILYCLKIIRQAIDQGTDLPTKDVLTDNCPQSISSIFLSSAEKLSKFSDQFALNNSISPSTEVVGGFISLLLPEHITSHLPSTPLEQQAKSNFTITNDLLIRFFGLLGRIAENLSEHSEEATGVIKSGCLKHSQHLTGPLHTSAFWLKMIILRTLTDDFNQQEEDFLRICTDKSKAADLFKAYMAIYPEANDPDYQEARGRVEYLLNSNKQEQKKCINLLLAAGTDAVRILEFYLDNPKAQGLMDRVARHNMPAEDKRSALSAITEYYNSEYLFIAALIETAAADNKLMPYLLEQDTLETLQGQGADYCHKLLDFLKLSKDPCCYAPVLKAIGNEDPVRASLMISSAGLSPKDHARKVKVIKALELATDSELPTEIKEDYIQQLLQKAAPAASSVKLEQAAFRPKKRERQAFNDSALNEAMSCFEKNNCGGLFAGLVETHGETAEAVHLACQYLLQYRDNGFFQQFLHDARLRKLYFKVILPDSEYRLELEERLKIFDAGAGNPKQEAELFRSWAEIKEKERNPAENNRPVRSSGETQLRFREPPAFTKILLIAPTQRVEFQMDRINESIPLLGDKNIEILDSENLIATGDSARHLNANRLVLYMTSSGSHSNFNALQARIPQSLRGNLYKFGGKKDLYSLLNFLNSEAAKQKKARDLL